MDSSGDDDDDDDENPANLSSSNEVYIVLTCPFNSMQYFIYFFLIFRPLSTARSKNRGKQCESARQPNPFFKLKKAYFFG